MISAKNTLELFGDVKLKRLGDYQGDILATIERVTWREEGSYGLYRGYYGSCSGCDAFEAASYGTPDDIAAQVAKTLNSVKWFDTQEDLQAYVRQLIIDIDNGEHLGYGEGKFVSALWSIAVGEWFEEG